MSAGPPAAGRAAGPSAAGLEAGPPAAGPAVAPQVAAGLADLTWPQVGDLAGAVLAIPLGATEQHGPHLPLSVDTDVAVELCLRLARLRSEVLVAPVLPYGASGEHAAFPGTLSMGCEALEFVLLELGRSATETFSRVLFVSGHGGNAEPVARAVSRLRAEGRDVRAHFPCWQGEPHAGRTETSMALSLDASRVRMSLAAAGDTRPLEELLPALRAEGVRAVSPSGVLGDPRGSNADEGADLLDRLAADLVRDVDRFFPDATRLPLPGRPGEWSL